MACGGGARCRRGGSTSLALALVAGPAAAGSWIAGIGVSSLGLVAAGELGVPLDRLVLVADPPAASWGAIVATLVDAFDVVLVRARRVGASDARRLTARARERGAVLVLLGDEAAAWPEAPDVRLRVADAQWQGLGAGHGHLRARRVQSRSTAGAARPVPVARGCGCPRPAVGWRPPSPSPRSARSHPPTGV